MYDCITFILYTLIQLTFKSRYTKILITSTPSMYSLQIILPSHPNKYCSYLYSVMSYAIFGLHVNVII